MTTDTQFLRVKTDTAPKTSLNAQGGVTYALLKDAASKEAYFCLLSNDGGGYFSREAVPFEAIRGCLTGVNTERPIPAKVFRSAFVGRSVNNAGFLMHALRHEQLLQPSPDAAHLHVLGRNWEAWKSAVLNLPGESFELPDAKKGDPEPKVVSTAEKQAAGGGKAKKLKKAESPPADTDNAGPADGDNAASS